MQLGSIKKREAWRAKQQGIPFSIKKYQEQLESCKNSLPFTLTNAQQQALDAIYHDLTQPTPMNRLLQGDVGSGKTIVAALSMYAAYLNGYQSTLMAPTEILATQHYLSIKKTLEPLGVQVELITGNKKLNSKKRESTTLSNSVIPAKAGISKDSQSNSKITFDILIGTHAILSEKVKFENLGLVVIDEQQRFGVEQRGIIKKKGKNPHFLTMTATPIPRTVALTMYGDLDLSYLDEMPQGRKRIKTWLVPQEKRQGAYDWIRKQIKETDCQVFLVCPFIEPSETMQTVKAVKDEYEKLKNEIFPDLKLGLLHGKQPAKEKEKTLHDFKNGKFSLLVATPVVEVGIDIPNATIIVIEASERFGLAQLHQLRGRVGRNDKQSYCLLFTESTNPQTTQRLKAMETMFSGAALAELDLKLRGAGNIFGTQQHGIPHLKAATFSDTSLIQKAKHAATLLYPELNQYPELLKKLESTENSNITPD